VEGRKNLLVSAPLGKFVENKKGKIYVVGFGPGAAQHLTPAAKEAIERSEVCIGYRTYIDLVRPLLTGKRIIATGMTEEIDRGRKAYQLAREGKTVAVVSSGDSGVYGMAGLVYEVLEEAGWDPEHPDVEVEIVPGITAMCSIGAILGAPLNHDFCSISLSNLLTPWEAIERRLEAAGMADFVVALYNPKSGRRDWQIVKAQEILLKYRRPDTPVGIVKSAWREGEKVVCTTLDKMVDHEIGMLTTILIGNGSTHWFKNLMVTPRGYKSKYDVKNKGGDLTAPHLQEKAV
jgi:precorrin-3B C17-methyltransferase